MCTHDIDLNCSRALCVWRTKARDRAGWIIAIEGPLQHTEGAVMDG